MTTTTLSEIEKVREQHGMMAINLFFTPDRRSEANAIIERLKSFGVDANLTEIKRDQSGIANHGKIFYFRGSDRARQIAMAIANSVEPIMKFSVQLCALDGHGLPDCAIWLTAKHRNRSRRRGGSLAPYTRWPWQSQSEISSSVQKCRYCGGKAIYNDSVCYQCQR